MKVIRTDTLIIGCGIAGAVCALELAKSGFQVVVITNAERPDETATRYAQGGIAYPPIEGEARERFIKDIMEVGAGWCYEPAVRHLAERGCELIEKFLIEELEVPFDRDASGELDFAMEAGHPEVGHPELEHTAERILHVEDKTGLAIQERLAEALTKNPNISLINYVTAIELLNICYHTRDHSNLYRKTQCIGAYVYDRNTKEVYAVVAPYTVLATGGLGQLYQHTTNPEGSRGDGIAMAHRIGAKIINLEYIQFHPTTFYHKEAKRFLITQELRRGGARLINSRGEEFMHRYDKRRELATHDVVSRAIHQEMLTLGDPCVFLDVSHKPSQWIRTRFPYTFAQCLSYGVDMTKDPIPVVPAEHYSCGGVWVDLNGETSVPGLFAVGEVACSGVHGANRAIGTALLEGLVWGDSTARAIGRLLETKKDSLPEIKEWKYEREWVDPALICQDWIVIKQTMWNYVGLVRSMHRLERADKVLTGLGDEIEDFYKHAELSDELIGLRNAIQTANLIVRSAKNNPTGRGCHFMAEG
ncbi:MAG: FAD-dependent oxidoreductase [Candidatus Methanosuratincola sp.]|jgi:L-aspartate oxidase